MSKAFTVAALAEEWECSEGVIRKMIADGRLACFRLGTLIRIPAEEVRRFECQNIPSSDCGEDTPSFTGTRKESASDASLRVAIDLAPKRRRGRGGNVLQAPARRSAGS
jgi:excisionase family DNA binding protein